MNDLLGIEDLDKNEIEQILDKADSYAAALQKGDWDREKLRGKIIINLFFEDSTRTLTSFEIAAKRLGADVINWNPQTSSLKKGESLHDTIDTLDAMRPDGVVVRHSEYGAPKWIAAHMECPVVNGGDGWREHPTQALLDALTMRQHFGSIKDLTIAIVGDIAHSRVAASNMILLRKMGVNVRVIAPAALMPDKLPAEGVEKSENLEEGIKGANIVMSIRPQKERMDTVMINDTTYYRDYGLTHEKLGVADKKAVVMDPGPFLRGVQISDELADDKERFLYSKQVANGIPVRMTVLDMLIAEKES